MAIRKICGIETEYGIIVRGRGGVEPDHRVVDCSSTPTCGDGQPTATWDARTASAGTSRTRRRATTPAATPLYLSFAPEVETHLVNAVLTNGSRYYVDHAHPELSTPECSNARQVLLYDRAGEEIMLRSMAAARALMPPGQEIVVYKNNSDGKGQSYGCHENYLFDRAVPFGRIVTHATAHFVTRQIFTGAGKVGTRGARGCEPTRRRSSSPSAPTSSRRRSASRRR